MSEKGYQILAAHVRANGVDEGSLSGLGFMVGFQHAIILARRHPEYARWLFDHLPDGASDRLAEHIDAMVREHPAATKAGSALGAATEAGGAE